MHLKHCNVLMTLTSLILFCIFVVSASTRAQAQQHPLLTHHVREAVANGQARLVGLLPGNQPIHLAIMLPLRNEAELDNLLQDLYDPNSPLYGHYLTVQEFTDRFGPTQEDYDAVIAFAEANGMTVTNLAPNRLVIDVTASVASIEQAFHIVMAVYQHPTEQRTFYAPDREPSVDLNVQLWHISGLDDFSRPHPLYLKGAATAKGNTTGSGQGGNFLGSDRRAAYYGGTSLTGAEQSVGLFEFDGYSLSDVQNYFTKVGQPLNVPITNVLLDGASAGSDGDDTEQVIDIVEAISMAPGLANVFVFIAPYSKWSNGGDTDIFNAMATHNPLPQQLSVSWWWYDDPSKDDPIFTAFKTQGQSLFVASGDYGAYYSGDQEAYPAEDASVTAVGGTELTTNGAGGSWASEVAWGEDSGNLCASGTGSGGGISPDGIPIPSYQQLKGVINSSNEGSTTLRNVPDVAAEANCDNYYCANGSCTTGLGGTSLAAPTWAGFAALVNQNNAASGAPLLGFINQPLYVNATTALNFDYHDISVGNNYNSKSPTLFPAVLGYDLVTGWGSPLATGWLSPFFAVAALPASSNVYPGNAVVYTIGVTSTPEFSGTVTLSVAGLPTGATGTFSPSSITGPAGASTLNVTTSSSTPYGTYPLTIKGTSGTVSHTTTVTLVVSSLLCTATTSCNIEGQPPGQVVAGQLTLSCNEATMLTASATICGNSGGCATTNVAPPQPVTSITPGNASPGNAGTCSFTWSWGGNNYSQELSAP